MARPRAAPARRRAARRPSTWSPQGNRLRWGWIPARALLCLMGDLEISEVGHGGGGIEAVLDRPFLGAEGPAPSLEGDLSAAGDPASGALRDAGGSGGFRRSPALGREERGFPAPVPAVQRWPSLPRHPQRARPRALQDLLRDLG